jgi:hypothetical protein
VGAAFLLFVLEAIAGRGRPRRLRR